VVKNITYYLLGTFSGKNCVFFYIITIYKPLPILVYIHILKYKTNTSDFQFPITLNIQVSHENLSIAISPEKINIS